MTLSISLLAMLSFFAIVATANAEPSVYPDLLPSSDYLGLQNNLSISYVERDGIQYRKFSNSFGSILLPRMISLNEIELEKAVCRTRGADKDLIKLEKPINSSDQSGIRLYASVVIETIEKKCAGLAKTEGNSNPKSALELGIEFESKGSNPTKYKIYNKDLGPNLNFNSNF